MNLLSIQGLCRLMDVCKKPFFVSAVVFLFFKIVLSIFLGWAPDYFPVKPINNNIFTRINL